MKTLYLAVVLGGLAVAQTPSPAPAPAPQTYTSNPDQVCRASNIDLQTKIADLERQLSAFQKYQLQVEICSTAGLLPLQCRITSNPDGTMTASKAPDPAPAPAPAKAVNAPPSPVPDPSAKPLPKN